MKHLGLHDIRKEYLDFFASKEHLILPSFSLIPKNDKSLLLIGAGMAPMKKYFTGEAVPPASKVSTCQKCIRTGDIENVGKTDRHATFFEMLGNFSFGDYFKHEAIAWAWEFLTVNLEINKDDLWVTVYHEDDEAWEIWNKEIGVPADHIVKLGKEDNFWELSVGPSGPCSEIYVDRGLEYGCGCEDCKPGCECDRFIEIWNLVFTQFDKDEEGNYNPLQNPNIDTGMGLERIATVLQETDNIFEIDAIQDILKGVCQLSNYTYGSSGKLDESVRVITDHIRAMTFMISDSIIPSNEGRGYVLRRLIRRAARHGRLLGLKDAFLHDLSKKVIDSWSVEYKDLSKNSQMIQNVILKEEERFLKTLETGMIRLEESIEKLQSQNNKVLSGKEAFKLYDTYGFPVDLTNEILIENDLELDFKEFEEEMEVQRSRAREARDDSGEIGWSFNKKDDLLSSIPETEFLGYESISYDKSNIIAILADHEPVEEIGMDEKGIFILDKSPFYGESGGQVGDTGQIKGSDFSINVEDTQKTKSGIIYCIGTVSQGIAKKSSVQGKVNKARREKIRRNHSVTHLLHQALKDVLGQHVSQAGSLVSSESMRFDFTHFEALSKDEISRVEEIVNNKIYEALDVKTQVMSFQEASTAGAIGLFEDKYGDNVRVVSMGEYSKELCGGTHVDNTAEIGMFKILSENGIAAGVRRIESITGLGVLNYLNQIIQERNIAADLLKTNPNQYLDKIKQHLEQEKVLRSELNNLQSEMAKSQTTNLSDNKKITNGISFITGKLTDVSIDDLRSLAEDLREKESALIVLSSVVDEKVNFVCASPKEAIGKGLKAGSVVKEVAKIAGGGGGGRPDMATAGGKNLGKVDEALDSVESIIEKLINSL